MHPRGDLRLQQQEHTVIASESPGVGLSAAKEWGRRVPAGSTIPLLLLFGGNA